MAGIDLTSERAENFRRSFSSYSRTRLSSVVTCTDADLDARGGPPLLSCEPTAYRASPAVGAYLCAEADSNGGDRAAVPDACNSIRFDFDEDEPPAVVFHKRARPGAMVSWAWCQLKALDALLAANIERRTEEEFEFMGAVRTILVPVINALEFSERRAAEMQKARVTDDGKGLESRKARKKSKPVA